mmetsp:Transcript_14689/g.17489  ORF Transcript_14689/g.17489 Transcript_14689/m.17489 type:complete len:306 (-) Transcript_14689:179-1096(-)
MSSLLVNGGNLNTNLIQKELVTALAEDRTYKVTDDAKKKHISTASSYDEFRHFVACADQKRVTHAEMESLSKPEKGWQKKTNLALGQTGKQPKNKSFKDKNNKSKNSSKNSISKNFPEIPPKNPMEFEREWRRHCKTSELKLKLLIFCGPKQLSLIFKNEIDVGLLGQIIKCFDDIIKIIENTDKTNNIDNSYMIPNNIQNEILSILMIIPKTGRFKLNVQFLDEKDKFHLRKVIEWIESYLLKEKESIEETIVDKKEKEEDKSLVKDELQYKTQEAEENSNSNLIEINQESINNIRSMYSQFKL